MSVYKKEEENKKLKKDRLDQIGVINNPEDDYLEIKVSGMEIEVVLHDKNNNIVRHGFYNISTKKFHSNKINNLFYGNHNFSNTRNTAPIFLTDDLPTYLAAKKDFRPVLIENEEDVEALYNKIENISRKIHSNIGVVDLTKNIIEDNPEIAGVITEAGYEYFPKSVIEKDKKAIKYKEGPQNDPYRFLETMLHIKKLVLSKANKYVSMSSLVNEAEEASRSGDNSPIETGIDGFNLSYGKILTVGGEPGIGKSSLLTSQVPTNLSRQGIEVHIFSFEMTAHDLIYKSLSRATLLCGGINYAKTHGEISSILDHEKDWTKKDKDVYSRAKLKTKLDSSQITIHSDEIYDRDYGRVLDISAFEKVAEERYMAGVKKQVFIIDYLQITPPEEDSNSSTTTEYLNMAMGKLKRIAKIYNVAVVILSSLNKESLTSKNDGLKSFRGSYRIGYASDAAAFMKYNDTGLGKNEKADFRNKEREKPFRRIQIEMLKSRYGSTNPINLIYCAPYSYFYQSMETARRYGLYFPTQENEFFTINDYKNSLSENDEGNNLEALEEKLPY